MTKQGYWISSRGCVYNINYMVWSTKYRRKVLVGVVRDRLLKLQEEIAREKGVKLNAQEVMPDDVHLIVMAHPKYPPASIVKIFKGITAKVLFEEFPELRQTLYDGHLWNPSYYCGTMGDVTKDVIERYVEMQKTK